MNIYLVNSLNCSTLFECLRAPPYPYCCHWPIYFTMFGKTALATAVGLLAAGATADIYYAGVAESSGEFGVWSKCSSSSLLVFLLWERKD